MVDDLSGNKGVSPTSKATKELSHGADQDVHHVQSFNKALLVGLIGRYYNDGTLKEKLFALREV